MKNKQAKTIFWGAIYFVLRRLNMLNEKLDYSLARMFNGNNRYCKVKVNGNQMYIDFNGSTDYVSVPTPSFIDDQQGSVECWIKFNDLTTGCIPLNVGVGGANDDEYHFLYFRGDSNKQIRLSIHHNTVATWITKTADNIITDSNWHHYVIVSDGSTVKLYLDNAERTLTDTTGTNSGQWMYDATDADVFVLGGLHRATLVVPFDGKIDNVRIWNRALSSGEVTSCYKGSAPRNGLVAEWLMNEMAGTTVADTSVNSNDGTISGADWYEEKFNSPLKGIMIAEYI